MTWNYRIAKLPHKDGLDDMFALVEAYYDDGNPVPHSYAEPHEISGHSPEIILDLLEKAKAAYAKPVIAIRDGKVIEL